MIAICMTCDLETIQNTAESIFGTDQVMHLFETKKKSPMFRSRLPQWES